MDEEELKEKIKEVEKEIMPGASPALVAKELNLKLGDYAEDGYSFAVEPSIKTGFKITCIKGDSFNLDWETTFDVYNFLNKDIAKKGNVLVSKLALKKKISDSWNIEITAEVNL